MADSDISLFTEGPGRPPGTVFICLLSKAGDTNSEVFKRKKMPKVIHVHLKESKERHKE